MAKQYQFINVYLRIKSARKGGGLKMDENYIRVLIKSILEVEEEICEEDLENLFIEIKDKRERRRNSLINLKMEG